MIVWQSNVQDSSGLGIFAQQFDPAFHPSGDEFQVNTFVPNHQAEPSGASLSDGTFVIVWNSYNQDSSGFGIYAQLFFENTALKGLELPVNTEISNHQMVPVVALLQSANFVVAWKSLLQDSFGQGVYARIFTPDGTAISAEILVNTLS